MKYIIAVCLCSCICIFSLAQKIEVIPMPNSVTISKGQSMPCNAKFVEQCSNDDFVKKMPWRFPNGSSGKTVVIEYILLNSVEAFLKKLPWRSASQNSNVAALSDAELSQAAGDAYIMKIEGNKVQIEGNEAACAMARYTLLQLIEKQSNVPACTIADEPRFKYRGMHLDVCRHFFTVQEVKQYIDYMARYKFNTFHFHLTEDQGWRIEIKKYPLLTQVGSRRAQTLIGKQKDEEGKGEYDATPEQGFFTQAEIKEIVAYAAQRYITVVPEIELPGHSLAAIASYPWLGCTQQAKKVGERWGVYNDVYCVGRDSTFQFLQDVLDEVMQLFPSRYIHIGGDEVVKKNWTTCTACQQRKKQEGLKDEHELQSYCIQRIEKYVNSKGRSIIGWDEILEGGLAPNATVMSWRGEKGGIEAAKQSHQVVMTPGSHCYFDHSQNKHSPEPLNIGGNTSYQKVYDYNPLPVALNASEQQYILGAQGNVWTEYIADWPKLQYMIMPRMQALSEVLWTQPSNKNLDAFTQRLGTELKVCDKQEINYRIPEPIGWKDTFSISKDFSIMLEPINTDYEIYYYSVPKGVLYTAPIPLSNYAAGKKVYAYLQHKKTKRQSVHYEAIIVK